MALIKIFLYVSILLFLFSCDDDVKTVITVDTMKKPEVLTLLTTKNELSAGDEVLVEALLRDTIDTTITLVWSCSGGEIVGTGTEVCWRSPAVEGSYTLSCVASNEYGVGDTRSTEVSVRGTYNSAAVKIPPLKDSMGVLFYLKTPVGSGIPGKPAYYYYCGSGSNYWYESFTNITYQTPDGEKGVVVFDSLCRPIQWITPSQTIECGPLRNVTDDIATTIHGTGREDATTDDSIYVAVVLLPEKTGENYLTYKADPGNLAPLAAAADAQEGGVSTLTQLWNHYNNPVTYSDLRDTIISRWSSDTAESAYGIIALTMFSTAHFNQQMQAMLTRETGERAGRNACGPLFGPALAELLKPFKLDFDPSPDPDDPYSIPYYALKCCGQSIVWKVCHYCFFAYEGDAGPCVVNCKASLDCFTDICMPYILDTNKINGLIR